MSVFSRREFGTFVLAGLPAAATLGRVQLGAAAPLTIGVSTASFRDLPRVTGRDNVDDIVTALKAVGTGNVLLAFANIEPAPPSAGPFLGGSAAYPQRVTLSPEQVAATNAGARAALRSWRLTTPATTLTAVRQKFDANGLRLHGAIVAFNDSFTDDELDAVCRQAKALGLSSLVSPLTLAMARRVAPVAARHGLKVAVHLQVDGNAAGNVGGSHIADVLAVSPVFMVALDTGNVTASNRDAVADLRAHHARVSHVLLSDRLRNGGTSQPFGEGDSPIDGVLATLHGLDHVVPAFVQYDYVGLRSAVDEVKTSLVYAARAL